MYSDKGIANICKKHGANAYLTKDVSIKELTTALLNIQNMDFYLSREISISQEIKTIKTDKFKEIIQLTNREIDIVKLMAVGKSSAEIANELYISTATVQTHRKNIFYKLNVKKASELVKYAIENNII